MIYYNMLFGARIDNGCYKYSPLGALHVIKYELFKGAKLWGNNQDPHVLAFHGIQDNAGSFDRLIPHLPSCYYYVCFDLPGHGQSSHFPQFLPIHTEDYMLFFKLMTKHFGREKYTLMGHSYGGQLSSMFTRLYPEYVERLVLLDTLHSLPVPTNLFHSHLRDKYEFIEQLNEKMAKNKPPTYTYEEALYKVVNQRHYGHLTEESAIILLQRGLVPTEDGKYYFSTDPRLRSFMNPPQDFKYILDYLKQIPFRCPVLIILGNDSELQLMYMKPIIKVFEKNKFVKLKYVPGHHDVHMNDPELVAKYVTTFFRKNKSKL